MKKALDADNIGNIAMTLVINWTPIYALHALNNRQNYL